MFLKYLKFSFYHLNFSASFVVNNNAFTLIPFESNGGEYIENPHTLGTTTKTQPDDPDFAGRLFLYFNLPYCSNS
jgi:hypothetical protein